jgi:hypothetical protein
MQCTNHLKQIGLGIHNFHDTRNGLPPALIGNGIGSSVNDGERWNRGGTIYVFLYPYMEQQALYEYFSAGTDDPRGESRKGFNRWFANGWWNSLTGEQKSSFSAITWVICPSSPRSSKFNITTDTGQDHEAGNNMASGPVTDYAMVINFENSNASSGTPWWHMGNTNTLSHTCQEGPFRAARLSDAHNANTWTTADTMARFQDGTSNQLCFGEKHIPQDRVGRCGIAVNANNDSANNCGDCNYLLFGEQRSVSIARFVEHAFAIWGASRVPGIIQPNIDGYVTNDWASFGSFHPGVCNFVYGDGSVHAISATIQPQTLAYLGHCRDGHSVSAQ